MYGNSPLGGQGEAVTLTPEQRQRLRQDITTVVSRTRELLPSEYIVGSELTNDSSGPRARIAVQPPRGPVVSADYSPQSGEVAIPDDEVDELVHGLAASAALQAKQAGNDGPVMAG